jgi:hypothetical protein
LVWNIHANLAEAAAEAVKLDAKEWPAGWRTEGVVDVGLIEKPLFVGWEYIVLFQAYHLGQRKRWVKDQLRGPAGLERAKYLLLSIAIENCGTDLHRVTPP